MLRSRILPILCLTLIGGDAGAETSPAVSTISALQAALSRARAGQEIRIAPGDYGIFETSANFAGPVTLVSADPSRPAHFSGMRLRGVRNLTFVNIDIGRSPQNEPSFSNIVEIHGGSGIRFSGGSIHGSLDEDPAGDLTGLTARETVGLQIDNTRFEDLGLGLVLYGVTNGSINNNQFRFIRSDAIDLAGVSASSIVGNRFSDFSPADGDHPDAIQCWTRNQAHGCRDLVISDNLIKSDPQHRIQGIFFNDEIGLWRVGQGHQRISVERNLIVSTLWNAIFFANPSDVSILDNIILNEAGGPPVPGGPVRPWIFVSGHGPFTLRGNKAPYFSIAGSSGAPPGNSQTSTESSSSVRSKIDKWLQRTSPQTH